jgi:hypothetical protein
MSNFENPIQFDVKKKIGDIEILYSQLMEISQGGPEVGNISINGKMVEGRYGGPALCKDEFVFVPAHLTKFLGTGFRLAKINAVTLNVEHIGKIKDLIFLHKIEGNRIYFFEDLGKSVQSSHEL